MSEDDIQLDMSQLFTDDSSNVILVGPYRVEGKPLQVRREPGQGGEYLGEIPVGALVTLTGRIKQVNLDPWTPAQWRQMDDGNWFAHVKGMWFSRDAGPQQQKVGNRSIDDPVIWSENGLTFTEMIRQEYNGNHCVFSAGLVEWHPVDTVYLKWQKDGDDGGMLLLTTDELAAIAWVATGTVWSVLADIPNGTGETS